MLVEFEWNEELGERWFNMANLGLCVYGQSYTKRELLAAKHVRTVDDDGNELIDVDA